MQRKNGIWALAASMLVVAAACDNVQDPAGVSSKTSTSAAPTLVGGVPTSTAFQVRACKDGPTGTYNFTLTGASANAGAIASPFTLTAGDAATECKLVANSDPFGQQHITVNEDVASLPSTVVFDHVDIYHYTGSGVLYGGTNPTTSSSSTSGDLVFGNDNAWTVVFVNVNAPSTGCTLTLGYWKTHNDSFGGGAPTDPTWALLPGGLAENTIFFLSGQTWFEVFWTAPAGNAYYQLAQQYMAAKLNILAGATAPANVLAAITDAETLFGTYTPAQIGALSGNNALRKQFITDAGVLGSYNEGTIGPGHCGTD